MRYAFAMLALAWASPTLAAPEMPEVVVKAAPEKRAAFERDFVWVQDNVMIGVNQYGAVVGTRSFVRPKRGLYGEEMTWPAFYDHIGRSDLSKQFKTRTAVKWGVFGAGVAVFGGGMALALTGISDLGADGSGGSGRRIAGYTLLGAGTVAMTVPLLLKTNPLKDHEVREAAATYNGKLLRDLGIEDPSTGFYHRRPRPWTASAGFWAVADGGGLQATIGF